MHLKWKVFFQFILFAAIVLACLWVFQIVFLDSFYKHIKTSEIRSAAVAIEHNIDNESVEELLIRMAQVNDVCIAVYDSKSNQLISVDILPDCIIHKLPVFVIMDIYQKALESGDEYIEIFSRDGFINNTYKRGDYIGGVPQRDYGMSESLLYAKTITRRDGSNILLLLNSTISPVNATVKTLRTQLVIITVIMVLLAFILALFISKRISKPIVKVNESAKELARGNYDTRFNKSSGDYLEIIELSDTLDYAASELSRVETLRRELIANISHDLRTPLTLISGYGEVIRDIPGENTPENIQIIIDESRHLSELVSDVLDISKIQSGEQAPSAKRFCLTGMIEEILKRYNKLISQDGYVIDFEKEENVYIIADELRLTQVVYNLINNAVNYTGEDKHIRVVQSVSRGKVKIEVIDSGEGIEEKDLPYIWDRYYKVDKTHKRARIGTGLGLSIVKSVLEQHGVKYGVLSKVGAGTSFWFEFDISEE